jgi:hypothetical protein
MSTLDDPQAYLGATPYLDFRHPSIAALADRLSSGSNGDEERAMRLHEFVQNEVLFGWAPVFDRQTASAVLASRIGFCNTKSTLFIALLRAVGIPARAHVAGISVRVLDGLINPRSAYVDHSWTELWLGNRWIKLDSYVLDRALYQRALARLRLSGGLVGFGVHINGRCDWDGSGDRFVQFVNDGVVRDLTDIDFGTFQDISAFNASGRSRTPANAAFRLLLRLLLRGANRRASRLRAEPTR